MAKTIIKLNVSQEEKEHFTELASQADKSCSGYILDILRANEQKPLLYQKDLNIALMQTYSKLHTFHSYLSVNYPDCDLSILEEVQSICERIKSYQ